MSSNQFMFILFAILRFAVIVNSIYRGPPDAVKMITVHSDCGFGYRYAFLDWDAFEVDTKSYKIEMIGVHGEKSITVEQYSFGERSQVNGLVDGLEPNGTYIVRVFAVNEYGQSPPSPDIIFSQNDSGCSMFDTDGFGCLYGPSNCVSRPKSPRDPIVEYMLGNRVNVTWTWMDSNYIFLKEMLRGSSWSESPVEFIIRYGDNKNTSLWNTRKTNNTWIILDDLKKDAQYSAYVITKNNNLTSRSPIIFPISLDKDMTGLPEPVITIESAFEKEVFTPGDPMTITCSIPPNANVLHIDIDLTVGKGDEILSGRNHHSSRSVTLYTTANENVDTAKCRVSIQYKDRVSRYKNQVSRSSYRNWIVEKPLKDENLRQIHHFESSNFHHLVLMYPLSELSQFVSEDVHASLHLFFKHQ
ncbi:hypothetical protein CAEBREN_00621 [Caenorhabditis brenneri]|uniref:Fibronectin type-III domain-containing protein n=1 Tax=Caenorhabditis brenneri TaxID=135651 RepID=G0NMJ3_CAEBE|nr:hypothetical protein CAEBREN_00621 [Caenorhabditis brenneri]